MRDNEAPIIVITPEAKAAVEAEAERAGADLTGGLLFGRPVGETHRLVLSSVRPRPETNFGQKDFCLDQSRTSESLRQAREMDPEAHYCGVWYVHRTPNQELTDEEWVQAQNVLEDPDFKLPDLVCLVVTLYFGEMNIHASILDRHMSAKGQLPASTSLSLTTEAQPSTGEASQAAPPAPPEPNLEWYRDPAASRRLAVEREQLLIKYRGEASVDEAGRVLFRLMPREKHEDMVFYLACEEGFPQKPPVAFLFIRGDRYPLVCPSLNEWTSDKLLVEVVDDLIQWQIELLDDTIASAEEALREGDFEIASTLLTMVLLIDPRRPRAARLLAEAPVLLKSAPASVIQTQSQAAHLPQSFATAAGWYKSPTIAQRLKKEYKLLSQAFNVEPSLARDGKLRLRLMPKHEHQDMVFYLAIGPGFPQQAPTAYLSLRGDRYPLLTPGLNRWTEGQRLVHVANELVDWQIHLLDEQITAAEEAIQRGDYAEASDLLVMVLLIDPRKPRAARMLAQAQAMLKSR